MSEEEPDPERRALLFSVWAALFMAALGIGFSWLTGSDAILLDGIFSLVGFGAGLASLRIARLVQQPDDERFQFGYSSFEPLFNVVKGLIIAVVGVIVLIDSIESILAGGREIEPGYAVVYAVLAAAACFGVYGLQRGAARRSQSSLVQVDASNWLIDGTLTMAVLIAFGAAYLMEGGSLDRFVVYVDPGVVALLVVLVAPVPCLIIRDNLNEVLLGAPEPADQARVQEALRPQLETLDAPYQVRMLKQGRRFFVDVAVIVAPEDPAWETAEQDRLRDGFGAVLDRAVPGVVLTVVFTAEERWAGLMREGMG